MLYTGLYLHKETTNMITQTERNVQRVERMCGGKGHVVIEHLMGDKELNGKCGLFAHVTLEKDCSLGYHEHHGETETYYILNGTGEYDDNGTKLSVSAGDVLYCKDGCGHGLVNTGRGNLDFIALIVKA